MQYCNMFQNLKSVVNIKWPTQAEKEIWWTKFSAVRRAKLKACYSNQNGNCFYCNKLCWLYDREQPIAKGAKENKATLEHLTPQMFGGFDHPRNLVMACNRCNNLRGVKDWQEFKQNVQSYIVARNKPIDKSYSEEKKAKKDRAHRIAVYKLACVLFYSPKFHEQVNAALVDLDNN